MSEFFYDGMDRLVTAEACILEDEEGVAFVEWSDLLCAHVRPDVFSLVRIACSVRIFSNGLSCPAMLSALCLSGLMSDMLIWALSGVVNIVRSAS